MFFFMDYTHTLLPPLSLSLTHTHTEIWTVISRNAPHIIFIQFQVGLEIVLFFKSEHFNVLPL